MGSARVTTLEAAHTRARASERAKGKSESGGAHAYFLSFILSTNDSLVRGLPPGRGRAGVRTKLRQRAHWRPLTLKSPFKKPPLLLFAFVPFNQQRLKRRRRKRMKGKKKGGRKRKRRGRGRRKRKR